MNVTVIGLLSGSVTLTLRVGEVDWLMAPFAGVGFEGGPGAAAWTGVTGTTANIDATSATTDIAIIDRPRVETENVDLVGDDPDRPRAEGSTVSPVTYSITRRDSSGTDESTNPVLSLQTGEIPPGLAKVPPRSLAANMQDLG
jgi:hypothetical protein